MTVETITRESEPAQEKQLEQKALSRQEQARAIKIADQGSLEYAAEELKAIVSLRKEIVDHHAPLRQTTHAAWQAAIAAEARVLEPVAEAERIIKGEIGRYTSEQERIRREEERRIREEQERQRLEAEAETKRLQDQATREHEAELERQIEEAESLGVSESDIDYLIKSQPAPIVAPPETVFMPLPVAAPTVAPVAGISTREIWSAEVTSVVQLAAFVGAHPEYANLLAPNMTALNGIARSLKSALKIPGVRAVSQTNVAARTR